MSKSAGSLAAVVLLLGAAHASAQSNVQTVDRLDPWDSKDDTDRTPIHTIVPEYPQKAWLERVEGDVEVCFYITRGGRPYNVRVRKSDNRIFERSARNAVEMSWFEAIPRGEKVPQIKTCRTFLFRLEPVDREDLEFVAVEASDDDAN